MSGLNMLDLFSGIGGFHEGFKRAGYQFDWVGFSEIDKYASAVYKYNYKESEELGDITAIRPERDLPDNIDILCGGFPCQAFSMAGKRLGFDDTRGTLFFEIARILTHYREKRRPIKCLVLENVKGLLSHDDGRTFATIYRVLNNLGYTIEFQLLNTRWWLPQNRERIYIVGYIGNRGGPQVFPIGEDGERNNEKRFSGKTTTGHKQGMLNSKDRRRRAMLRGSEKIEEVQRKYKVVDALYKNRQQRDYKSCVPTLRKNSGNLQVQPVLTPNRAEKRQNGRRFKEDGEDMFTLTQQDQHEVKINTSIRRLTPVECMRLQGFADNHNEYGIIDDKVVEISDTQRYKQAGNAVTVDVVEAVATIIKEKELL